MTISNQALSDLLQKFADLLEIHAANPYRVRAYRRAARMLLRLDKNIHELIEDNYDLTSLPTIGPGIASQIRQIAKTNKLPEIFKNKNKLKPFRNELLQIGGLGKKRIALLKEQGITTKKALLEAIKNGHLSSTFSWITPSFEKKLLYNIDHPKPYEKFLKYKIADVTVNYLLNQFLSWPDIKRVVPASHYRRKCEMVGNIDWIIQTENPQKIIQRISELDIVKELVSRDENTVSVISYSSLLMTFYMTTEDMFASYLLCHTGSAQHVDELLKYAKNKQITVKNDRYLVGNTEENIYKQLGLSYIEPELRENRGEIQAAEKHKLPTLILLSDIRGDLHSHTNETDGIQPLEVMVEAAIAKGYEYFAVTDHSKRLTITNGLDEKRLLQQIELINELNSKYSTITILKSIEVDILEDGSLDLSDEVLKELDLRVCSIHSKFKLPEDKQTERMIRAMDNPYFNVLGHMTGRLLTSRSPYALQIEKIFTAAKERGCFIELNAQPARLDINDIYCKQAKEMGVKVSIASDAHSTRELDFMQYGVNQARRGWLEKEDVINTRSLPELLKLFKRK